MTDHPRTDGTTPTVFGDDRLLALALGFDDDPELIAAAAADEGLRRRLDTMRAEVEQVAAHVLAAVPAPEADYADPSDARWAALQGFFAAPKARSRGSRWLRVLAPAAVALVAVAVGLAVINDQKSGTVSMNGSVPAAAKASSEAAGPLSGGGAAPSDRAADNAQALHDQIDQFALVVLAKARAAQGAVQRFAVVRVLKGTAPAVLRLRIADGAVPVGRLHLLLLRPRAGGTGEALNAGGPSTTKSGLGDYGAGKPVTYSYHGEPALAQELPPGTDPKTVTLP